MAITNLQPLGKWTGGDLFARIFDGKNYVTQPSGDGGFLVRGRALVGNVDAGYVIPTTGAVAGADILTLEQSDTFGVQMPQSFVTPTGYTKVIKGTATIYYPNSVLEQNPTLANDPTDKVTAAKSADTFFTKIWAWVQANPFQSVAIAFGLYVFIIEPMLNPKGKKKGILAKLF